MRLTEYAISLVKTPEMRRALQTELKKTEQTITRYINDNEENGPLTTAGALTVIRTHTGLTDTQILEQKSTVPAA